MADSKTEPENEYSEPRVSHMKKKIYQTGITTCQKDSVAKEYLDYQNQ